MDNKYWVREAEGCSCSAGVPIPYISNNRWYGFENFPDRCPKPNNIILKCGHRPQDAVFDIDQGEVIVYQKFVLDRLRVDTSKMCDPVVKLDFTSIIAFEATYRIGAEHQIEVELLFKLIRICNGDKEVVQTWKYEFDHDIENDIDELRIERKESFAVSFCDNPCPGCCEYKMVVEVLDTEGNFDFLRVKKPNLTAIAQG